jgi:hypothetical protein
MKVKAIDDRRCHTSLPMGKGCRNTSYHTSLFVVCVHFHRTPWVSVLAGVCSNWPTCFWVEASVTQAHPFCLPPPAFPRSVRYNLIKSPFPPPTGNHETLFAKRPKQTTDLVLVWNSFLVRKLPPRDFPIFLVLSALCSLLDCTSSSENSVWLHR